jgi:flagellar basal-body rod protein FlgG
MLRALYSSATGLAAQQFNLDVLANNLANASTTGFKANRANFQDLMYQVEKEPGTQTGANSQLPTGSQVGLGVSSGTTSTDFSQGTLSQTGGTYDLAITGQGFFKLLLPDGTTGYTRAGSLNIDNSGKLVNSQGFPLQPEIVIPSNKTSVTIGADGQVSVTVPGQAAPQIVGQITLSNFPNPAGLLCQGGSIFQPSQASGQATDGNPGSQGLGTLTQGSLESSNVSIMDSMVQMIVIQRAYETNSKVVQAADEMLQTTNGIKR